MPEPERTWQNFAGAVLRSGLDVAAVGEPEEVDRSLATEVEQVAQPTPSTHFSPKNPAQVWYSAAKAYTPPVVQRMTR